MACQPLLLDLQLLMQRSANGLLHAVASHETVAPGLLNNVPISAARFATVDAEGCRRGSGEGCLRAGRLTCLAASLSGQVGIKACSFGTGCSVNLHKRKAI